VVIRFIDLVACVHNYAPIARAEPCALINCGGLVQTQTVE